MTSLPVVTVPWYLARNPFTGGVFSRASALERSQKCCVYREFGRALVSNCYVDHAFVTQFLASACKWLLCWTSLFDCVWRHFLLFQCRDPCSLTVYLVCRLTRYAHSTTRSLPQCPTFTLTSLNSYLIYCKQFMLNKPAIWFDIRYCFLIETIENIFDRYFIN